MANRRAESNRFTQQQRRSQIIIVVEANSTWLNWCVVGWATSPSHGLSGVRPASRARCPRGPASPRCDSVDKIAADADKSRHVAARDFAHPTATARRKFSSKGGCWGSCSNFRSDRERIIFYLSQCFDSYIECHSGDWRNFACAPLARLFLVEFVRFPWRRKRGGWQAASRAYARSTRRPPFRIGGAPGRAHSY